MGEDSILFVALRRGRPQGWTREPGENPGRETPLYVSEHRDPSMKIGHWATARRPLSPEGDRKDMSQKTYKKRLEDSSRGGVYPFAGKRLRRSVSMAADVIVFSAPRPDAPTEEGMRR